eukprot:TRINITY_DN10579_c1_g1_i1.p1 TRINITY_DN10579_c1_g1~~TRINITY_DN10579_c1_g1_i1.p1  ORF type:complete len:867 (-),score=246.84 TRINITY_DN10579_c1_g1_i1:82-2682(-)
MAAGPSDDAADAASDGERTLPGSPGRGLEPEWHHEAVEAPGSGRADGAAEAAAAASDGERTLPGSPGRGLEPEWHLEAVAAPSLQGGFFHHEHADKPVLSADNGSTAVLLGPAASVGRFPAAGGAACLTAQQPSAVLAAASAEVAPTPLQRDEGSTSAPAVGDAVWLTAQQTSASAAAASANVAPTPAEPAVGIASAPAVGSAEWLTARQPSAIGAAASAEIALAPAVPAPGVARAPANDGAAWLIARQPCAIVAAASAGAAPPPAEPAVGMASAPAARVAGALAAGAADASAVGGAAWLTARRPFASVPAASAGVAPPPAQRPRRALWGASSTEATVCIGAGGSSSSTAAPNAASAASAAAASALPQTLALPMGRAAADLESSQPCTQGQLQGLLPAAKRPRVQPPGRRYARLAPHMRQHNQSTVAVPKGLWGRRGPVPQLPYIPVEDPVEGLSYMMCCYCDSDRIFRVTENFMKHVTGPDCPRGRKEFLRLQSQSDGQGGCPWMLERGQLGPSAEGDACQAAPQLQAPSASSTSSRAWRLRDAPGVASAPAPAAAAAAGSSAQAFTGSTGVGVGASAAPRQGGSAADGDEQLDRWRRAAGSLLGARQEAPAAADDDDVPLAALLQCRGSKQEMQQKQRQQQLLALPTPAKPPVLAATPARAVAETAPVQHALPAAPPPEGTLTIAEVKMRQLRQLRELCPSWYGELASKVAGLAGRSRRELAELVGVALQRPEPAAPSSAAPLAPPSAPKPPATTTSAAQAPPPRPRSILSAASSAATTAAEPAPFSLRACRSEFLLRDYREAPAWRSARAAGSSAASADAGGSDGAAADADRAPSARELRAMARAEARAVEVFPCVAEAILID